MKRLLFTNALLLLGAGLLATGAYAQHQHGSSLSALESAMEKTTADIDRDTAALNRLREEIVRQRKPLAAELESLQKCVSAKRTRVENMRTVRQQSEKAQSILESDVAGLEEECRFIQTLFSEYRRAMDTRAGVAESAHLKTLLDQVGDDLSENEEFKALAENVGRLIEISSGWRNSRIGSNRFEGVALDHEGIEHAGRFAVFGPMAFFSSQDRTLSGMAVTRFGSALPSVFNRFDAPSLDAVAQLVEGAEGIVPLDVTAGDAIKIEETKDSFFEQIKKGGFVIWPLLGVGLLAAILALWKLITLSRVQVRADERIAAILDKVNANDTPAAEALARKLPYPLSDLLHEAVVHAHVPREHLEEIMHEHVMNMLPKLEAHLGTLAVFGGVAPLLGLLGTVTGMIHTFQLVTLFGSGDAKLLSGGISEALITTEFGLAIAIPVLLAHAFLAKRANTIIGALEQTAITVVNDLKIRTDDERATF